MSLNADDKLSGSVSAEHLAELSQVFETIDLDGNGFISAGELGYALEVCGFKLAQYEVRNLLLEFDTRIKDEQLDMKEFAEMYALLKDRKSDKNMTEWKSKSRTPQGVLVHGGMSDFSVDGTTHTVTEQEQHAFAGWINRNLSEDADCQKYLPLNPDSRDIYVKTSDGIMYCKLINASQPGTIDERTINKGKLSLFQMHENLTLALTSALSIGCCTVNIGPEDLRDGKPHLVLGLLWQIIRIGLLSDVNLVDNPNLTTLLAEGESIDDFRKLSPEQILIRWVNYHLAKSGCGRQVTNFTSDIKDSIAYIHLLHQIAPKDKGVSTTAENESDVKLRAEKMLQEADKIGCRAFVSAEDVVSGNYKLNLAFVANLFNSHPALEPASELDLEQLVLHHETREEKMYRNWMNSLGVQPYVNHLYSDLTDALVIFQLYDKITPGCVDYSKVTQQFNKLRMMMEKIANCNYAVELGRKAKFSLVGIQGKDIYDSNETLTLALVWQLMKAYTLSLLSKLAQHDSGHPIVDKEIVAWANDKLKAAGKDRQISGFNDSSISDAKVVLDLIDAIKKGCINYSLVKPGDSEQERLDNAKLAVSMARKIGARVYALPEDIVEVKSKMVMTVFACLMIRDLQPSEQPTTQQQHKHTNGSTSK